MVTLVYGIVRSAEAGWTDRLTMASLAAGIVLHVVFDATERHAAQPVMPLSGG